MRVRGVRKEEEKREKMWVRRMWKEEEKRRKCWLGECRGKNK